MAIYLTAKCISCHGPADRRSKSGRCAKCRIYMTAAPIIDRVMERIIIDANECWLWPGATTSAGYGQVRETVADGGRSVLTHRATFAHYVGPVPDGLDLDHLCRVRRCCNPDHLEPVTRLENVRRGDAAKPRKVRPCIVCHIDFMGRPWALTCGPECRTEAGRRAAYKRWRQS